MTNDPSEPSVLPDALLPAILDAFPETVFVIDAARRVQFANRSARSLFGASVVGHDFVRAIRNPECLSCVDAVLGGQGEAQAFITLSQPAPTRCQVNVVALERAQTDAQYAVVTLTDVSQIQDAEKMRSDFVANVSHELRSPLTALSGFIETLKGAARNDPEARTRFLDVMEAEASRMNRLIDDLLSLSKVETNKRVQPTERIDVSAIAERVITTLSPQAETVGKEVLLECEDALPKIRGDGDELTQIFQNLIENAIKYSDPDTNVTVSIAMMERVAGIRGPSLRISVRDQGSGIPRAHIPRLTERFYRVDDGRGRDQGGTGLGLAIVKHIVGRHRGRLQISSESGAGSTFNVFLPCESEAS